MREKSDPMLPYHCYGLDHFYHEYEALARVDTDGCWYKRDEVDAELAALREEVEDQAGLIKRLSDLLNSAVNVLRGPPPDDTLWSFHDVAERAEALRAQLAERDAQLRALLLALEAPPPAWIAMKPEALKALGAAIAAQAKRATESAGGGHVHD